MEKNLSILYTALTILAEGKLLVPFSKLELTQKMIFDHSYPQYLSRSLFSIVVLKADCPTCFRVFSLLQKN